MINQKYDEVFTFENLYKAHLRGRLSKRDKKPLVKFEINMLDNLQKLQVQLQERKFKIRRYSSFTVYEPKKREIQTLEYGERVVQHILCDNLLAPYFTQRAIVDNCVCQKGKGTHFGLERFEAKLRKHIRLHGNSGWVLKCDIKKYFPSMPHSQLTKMICGEIKDKDISALIAYVIDSYHTRLEYLQKYDIPPLCTPQEIATYGKDVRTGRGIPIGNQTSQIFGMFYLDGLDRIVKEELKIKIYSRYMDDFVLVHKDKAVIENALHKIEAKVAELGLFLNSKTQIFPLKNGLQFLGFRYFVTKSGKLVKQVVKRTARRMRWRVRLLKRAYTDGSIDAERIRMSLVAIHGHLSHGNCHILEENLRAKLHFATQTPQKKKKKRKKSTRQCPISKSCEEVGGNALSGSDPFLSTSASCPAVD